MIRRVAGLFLQIWVLVVSACRRVLGRKKANKQQQLPGLGGGGSNEQWREDKWEEWDPIGVVVEKHDSPTTVTPVDTPVGTPAMSKEDEFFADIQPEIKAPPKIRLKMHKKAPDIKFTVDPSFQSTTSMGPELADWPDDEEEQQEAGWDTGLDSTDIELQTKEMMRQKRAEERKKRRQQQSVHSSVRPALGASRIPN